jgi:hypothetical protein
VGSTATEISSASYNFCAFLNFIFPSYIHLKAYILHEVDQTSQKLLIVRVRHHAVKALTWHKHQMQAIKTQRNEHTFLILKITHCTITAGEMNILGL